MLRTSPSTRPSIWMSPEETSVPLITTSALMMEGAASWRARRCGISWVVAWGAGRAPLLLLENIAARLNEVVGVFDGIVVPDFVMDMRSGAAAGGADPAQAAAFGQRGAGPHRDRRQMAIACVDAIAVIDFHHVAIAPAITGEHHFARRRGAHRRTPGTRKVDAGMEGITPSEGIDARAKSAAAVKTRGVDRHG